MTDAAPVSLASLMTPSKTVSIDFPGYDGMKVSLCYLAREELLKLRKKCVTTKFSKKTRQPEEILDEDKFLVEYCKAVIKTWSGFKYSYLEELLLVDISSLDPNDELLYTQENAELLMKNSNDFDTWITETVGDLENFTSNKSRD
tara:strand:+ start:831 stop:1265 length:435 start_codon:yes stop_codon:yes gene_type:complete